jgi:hypothetical protein
MYESSAFKDILIGLNRFSAADGWGKTGGPTVEYKLRFYNGYVEKFRVELGEKLLARPTTQQKCDLIIYYISELARATMVVKVLDGKEHEELITDAKSPKTVIPREFPFGCKVETAEERIHFRYLFTSLFNIIQTFCNLYYLPFLKICYDQSFPLDTIDITLTVANEERKKLSPFAQQSQESIASAEVHPVFSHEYVPQIYNILKGYFPAEQQNDLLMLLETGGNVNKPLRFISSGSQLADVFKQLFDGAIIKGCQKKDLQNWVMKNFYYLFRGEVKEFTLRYLHDIISSKKDKCQKPILDIKLEKGTGNYLINRL